MVDEGLAEIRAALHPVRASRQHHSARAGGVGPGLVDAGRGYATVLQRFDGLLPGVLQLLHDDDVLFITGDHGNDPTTGSSRHTREYTPVLVAGPRVAQSEVPPWAVVGLGRQDELLSHADLVICGGGHGMVSKTLLAGVPLVVVPGGGDQWEIANRVVRQGSARLVRPLTSESLVAAVTEVLSTQRYRDAAQRAGAGVAEVEDPVRVCHEALAPSA